MMASLHKGVGVCPACLQGPPYPHLETCFLDPGLPVAAFSLGPGWTYICKDVCLYTCLLYTFARMRLT